MERKTNLLPTRYEGSTNRAAAQAATAEHPVLQALDVSCRTPIGAYARLLPDGELHITGLVARADGASLLEHSPRGASADALRLGIELGTSLWLDSPRDVFA